METDGQLGDEGSGNQETPRLAEIRRQLAKLVRSPGRRHSAWTSEAPTEWRPLEVISPESGLPFSNAGAWEFIAQCLEDGCAITELILEKPPGEKAYVIMPRLGGRRVYIKLQLRNSRVLGRSFHYSEVDSD